MKNLLLIAGLMIMVFNAHAAGIDKGNGGSGSESKLVGQQAQLESVALKLRTFFLKNEATLKPMFPEFDIQVLVKKIKISDIRVVDESKLIDKHGRSRTCLNFSDSSLIECKSLEIEQLFDQPSALFVLVLHEYLGLIGAEETSPEKPTMIAGYSISKRIAPFVSKVNDYDLIIPKKVVVAKDQAENRVKVINASVDTGTTGLRSLSLFYPSEKSLIKEAKSQVEKECLVEGKTISFQSAKVFDVSHKRSCGEHGCFVTEGTVVVQYTCN